MRGEEAGMNISTYLPCSERKATGHKVGYDSWEYIEMNVQTFDTHDIDNHFFSDSYDFQALAFGSLNPPSSR